jgi:hypothetical protein
VAQAFLRVRIFKASSLIYLDKRILTGLKTGNYRSRCHMPS